MSLITMVYVSAASENLTDEQLRELLAVCRRNNQRSHITGMLLYRNGCSSRQSR
ncbi:MAG: BLUF domain-containing protein, partial [Rhodomicrobium sp.]|nr:BLUF domain-containing protein [Rhodomicrobium sp.]